MSLIKIMVFIAGVASSALASASATEDQQSLSLWQTPINILPGESTTALMRYRLPGMERVNGIHVSLKGQGGRECPAMVRDVEIEFTEGAQLKRFELDGNGRIALPQQGMLGFVLNFRNYQVTSVPCFVDVRALMGYSSPSEPPQPPNPPSPPTSELDPKEFSFVGVMRYRGGFANTLVVPVATQGTTTHIWLRTPEFCAGLEILAAEYGVVGEYWMATADKTLKGAYVTKGDGVAGVDSIRLIANGPVELHCDIPVYLRTVGGGSAGGGGEPFEP